MIFHRVVKTTRLKKKKKTQDIQPKMLINQDINIKKKFGKILTPHVKINNKMGDKTYIQLTAIKLLEKSIISYTGFNSNL